MNYKPKKEYIKPVLTKEDPLAKIVWEENEVPKPRLSTRCTSDSKYPELCDSIFREGKLFEGAGLRGGIKSNRIPLELLNQTGYPYQKKGGSE